MNVPAEGAPLPDSTLRAVEALLPFVYEDLRQIARSTMAREPAGQTLQPTALVHEALLRLFASEATWEDRSRLMTSAVVAMRRVLIERARRRRALKRGPDARRIPLDTVDVAASERSPDFLDLDEALEKLARIDPEKCAIVTLRHLLGCSVAETGRALEISEAKVKKDWQFARAWLRWEMLRDTTSNGTGGGAPCP